MKKQIFSLALVLVLLVCITAINAHARVSAGDKMLAAAVASTITLKEASFSIVGLGVFSYFITSHINIPAGIIVNYESGGATSIVGLGGCRYFINPDNPKLNFYVGGQAFLGYAGGFAVNGAACGGPWFNLTKNIFLTCDVYFTIPDCTIMPMLGIAAMF
jgi:hypothetical protein